jgi:predicted metal-dependent hydrolase
MPTDWDDVIIIRKKIKHLYLRIDGQGQLLIHAPLLLSRVKIRSFLDSKHDWIVAARAKIAKQSRPLHYNYTSGEMHQLFGKSYPLHVLDISQSAKPSVELGDDTIIMHAPAEFSPAQREDLLNAWYRKHLQQVLPALITKCQMITAQEASSWHIKKMRTKWGSCNIGARRIWLSLQLARYDYALIEYVMIHELVHFYERYHNERFKFYMHQFCPNATQLEAMLNG